MCNAIRWRAARGALVGTILVVMAVGGLGCIPVFNGSDFAWWPWAAMGPSPAVNAGGTNDDGGTNDEQTGTLSVSLAANPAEGITVGQQVTVTATVSTAANSPVTYLWSATGAIEGTTASVTWTVPATAGTYTISCQVSTDDGGSADATLSLTVSS